MILGGPKRERREFLWSEELEEASAVVAKHVKLLREYNQIKDVGQQLMGMVAEKRGVTVGSLYETREFGVGPKD
ncbi:hypothetical protein HER10_EVM0006033 [Colletotrichum scovillei]|uniref:uncharacterized protein n=1 Tax=Colletotrichum scovillei TaxID=1209932 RepID=UPI0015C406BF|nr:uncharacterized protein HER10_EVM0006033 [Colletotrichum scovillei]KAF4785402.1 hypothetical protein HER10_EVM0006033 [Colletotrichum scovillei]